MASESSPASRPSTCATPPSPWQGFCTRDSGVKTTFDTTAQRLGFNSVYLAGDPGRGKAMGTGIGYMTPSSENLRPSTVMNGVRRAAHRAGVLSTKDVDRLLDHDAKAEEVFQQWLQSKQKASQLQSRSKERCAKAKDVERYCERQKMLEQQCTNRFNEWLFSKTAQAHAQHTHVLSQVRAVQMARAKEKLREAQRWARAQALEEGFTLRQPTLPALSNRLPTAKLHDTKAYKIHKPAASRSGSAAAPARAAHSAHAPPQPVQRTEPVTASLLEQEETSGYSVDSFVGTDNSITQHDSTAVPGTEAAVSEDAAALASSGSYTSISEAYEASQPVLVPVALPLADTSALDLTGCELHPSDAEAITAEQHAADSHTSGSTPQPPVETAQRVTRERSADGRSPDVSAANDCCPDTTQEASADGSLVVVPSAEAAKADGTQMPSAAEGIAADAPPPDDVDAESAPVVGVECGSDHEHVEGVAPVSSTTEEAAAGGIADVPTADTTDADLTSYDAEVEQGTADVPAANDSCPSTTQGAAAADTPGVVPSAKAAEADSAQQAFVAEGSADDEPLPDRTEAESTQEGAIASVVDVTAVNEHSPEGTQDAAAVCSTDYEHVEGILTVRGTQEEATADGSTDVTAADTPDAAVTSHDTQVERSTADVPAGTEFSDDAVNSTFVVPSAEAATVNSTQHASEAGSSAVRPGYDAEAESAHEVAAAASGVAGVPESEQGDAEDTQPAVAASSVSDVPAADEISHKEEAMDSSTLHSPSAQAAAGQGSPDEAGVDST